MQDRILHVDHSEGIYFYDREGNRWTDWSAGAVCTNLGNSVPDSIRQAIIDQIDSTAFTYGDLCSTDNRARCGQML